jgi:hypothetical protein
MARGSKDASFYRLRVTLDGVSPPIWREVVVRSGMTLGQLHQVLQAVMGWTDSHLHVFRVGKVALADLRAELDVPVRDEHAATIDEIVRIKTKKPVIYEYDFGDGWVHEIEVEPCQEEANLAKRKTTAAYCVAGARACPPEDCGGIFGYEDLVDAIADPEHPRREELLEWLGVPFDPESFDLAGINRELMEIRVR